MKPGLIVIGSGGASSGGARGGGRGRGRARGGSKAAKNKTGGRGSSAVNNTDKNSSSVDNDCVNIIINSKDISSTTSRFSRQRNGSLNSSGLRLGGIPRRPQLAVPSTSSSSSTSNNNSNNAVNLNNGGPPGPGSDYYLHKKFKKVTATVEPGDQAPNESASTSSSTTNGMVYKPKFRIKSDLEVAEEGNKVESSSASPSLSSAPELPVPSPTTSAVNLSVKPAVTAETNVSSSNTVKSSGASQISLFPVNSSLLINSTRPPVVSSCPSSGSSFTVEPAKINKEMRIDRKSLDDRISKIIDENQSILEWPEQFTKRLKNHAGRSNSQQHTLTQNSLQRTSHLLSGGSTVELSCSSSTASLFTSSQISHHPRNGLLRHHSSSSLSDGMPTCGGSVELVVNNQVTSSPHHLPSVATASLLKPSSDSSLLPTDLSFGAQKHEAHHRHHNGSGGTVTSTVPNSPPVSPPFASSTSSTTTTTSTMVPKKRRRLSATPSRLCGGEVSELPVNQSGAHGIGEKGYFQDMDMTVRVSNCGPSGAKVTIRTNNGAVSGGSVVDFPKMIESSPSAAMQNNGAIFFAGPSPSSPVPLSLITSKKPGEASLLSPRPTAEKIQTQKPPKSPRGRTTKSKKFETSTTTTTSVSYSSSSLLKLAHPQPQLPEMKLLSTNNPPPIPGPSSLLSPGPSSTINQSKVEEPSTARAIQVSVTSSSTPTKSENSDPVNKSNDPNKETSTIVAPLTVVPTNTSQNPKRPTFLALKPVNVNSKKIEPGVLPSPETPRVSKPYNQMTINGQAYTYLGFKVSTRSSYTCLFKTQPMFIPQESDPKLSMYTNWQPRPIDPNQIEIGISTNDSRVNGRKSPHHILYTSAIGKGLDTMTVSSPDNQPPISSPVCEQKTFLSGLQQQGPQVSEMPSSSTSTDQVFMSKLLKVQVSPVPGGSSSGVDPISPPSSRSSSSNSSCNSPPVSSSRISRQSNMNSGALMSVASSLSPNPIMTTSTNQVRRMATSPPSGGSDTSSAEESGERRRSNSNASEGPLSLTRKQMGETSKEQRIKTMEGGFESNEDYTYVRGRGRGRYVCEACGIRCKKPSMLRKHLKTHTDLRPYTCKLCNFSFKTKGNLTKHQKSKSHLKKCAGLGIHPESSRSLAVTGPGAFSISDTNTTDENESDDDMDDDNGDMDEATDSQEEIGGDDDTCSMTGNERMDVSGVGNGNGSFEKEIAQSLLDLSKATFQPRVVSHGSANMGSGSGYDSGGDQDCRGPKRPSYPFNAAIEDISHSSVGSVGETMGAAAPIDLSVKPTTSGHLVTHHRLQTYEHSAKRMKMEESGESHEVDTIIVKEAEKWEPPADEEAMMGVSSVVTGGGRCFNLKTVLNRNSIEGRITNLEGSPSSELLVRKMTEVKTEVTDYADSSYSQSQLRGLHDRSSRQRTESETSSCSSLGTGGGDRTTPLPSQQSSSSNGGGSGAKLHQPWLSPSERKEKKLEAIEILPSSASSINAQSSAASKPPAIETRPLSLCPVPGSTDGPSKFVKLSARSDDENGMEVPPPMGPPGSLAESPNSKLFSGLTALKPQAEFRQPSGAQALVKDEGKAECNVCGKTFARASQLTLHMNIHYIERPFRCDPCGVSFRTKGHLIKHRRSSSHDCKVYLTEAWGVANEENPRPFKCTDCKIAFRIHGHLAKHLRSKMHIMRMECLGKLPFGIYFEMEKSGINLNEIDTTDCDMSLVSLQNVARKIYGEQWRERLTVPTEEPSP